MNNKKKRIRSYLLWTLVFCDSDYTKDRFISINERRSFSVDTGTGDEAEYHKWALQIASGDHTKGKRLFYYTIICILPGSSLFLNER